MVSGRTVVISGGGTGIGLATAEAFARGGDTPVLIGRRADVLERAAERIDGAVPVPADLTDPPPAFGREVPPSGGAGGGGDRGAVRHGGRADPQRGRARPGSAR
ncbi:SDR family NAD(P)-dependent oxidoreductase [Streptomyces xiamenensis]